MIDLSNKVTIITGGSRGIGEACVKLFLKANAKVAFTYKSAKSQAEKLEKELGKSVVSNKNYLQKTKQIKSLH